MDRQFATELGIPVHVLSPVEVPRLAKALKAYRDTEVLYQNTPEMRRAVKLVAQALNTNTMHSFDDCIALDRSMFEFSPVYSVFNKRAKKAFRKPDDSLWTPV